ncbi:unnamed protein product [Schistosoma curassoni]|nr:unnamed protein product [Schistosoma curassoni]
MSPHFHQNDLMTPYPLESKRVSRITLAYFEDIKGQDIEPYCDIPKEPKCAGYENGIGGCLLYEHDKQLNETFQYMDNLFPFTAKQKEKYGGHMAFDYCPVLIIQPGVNGSSLLCEQKDDLKTDSMLNMFMEYRGPNSGCFNDETQTYVNKSGTYTIKKKSSCHKFQCSKNIGVQVIFNEKAFQCPVGGGPLHMEQQLRSGNAFIDIQCPKCTSLCESDSIYSQNIVKRSSNRLNLKITPVYDRKVETSKVFSKIKRAVEGAVKFWEKALIVEVKKPENVVIQRTCKLGSMVTSSNENKPHCRRDTCKKSETCFHTEIPDKYLSACHARKHGETKEMFTEGEGIAPNEFVLLVSRNYVSCGGNVLAWASYCNQDPDTSRPNLGIVNYCLAEDDILRANEKKLEDVTKHEICHALWKMDFIKMIGNEKDEFSVMTCFQEVIVHNVSLGFNITFDILSVKFQEGLCPNIIHSKCE